MLTIRTSHQQPKKKRRAWPLIILAFGVLIFIIASAVHIMSGDDTLEQKTIGELWEARSGGTCLFRVVGKSDYQQTLLAATA